MRQTKSTKPQSETNIVRTWHVIDIKNKTLGRTTNGIARLLQGKQKKTYAPYIDAGDYVVVVNAKKVHITGRKAETKVYSNYSGYPGGLRVVTYKMMMERNPGEIIKHAVSGMLPKNKLRDRRLARLFIFNEEDHPYQDKFTKL